MPPAIPDKITCTTPAELERELHDIRITLALTESEDNWEKIARALQTYAALARGGATKIDPDFGKALRELNRAITSAMCSERTRLSGTACDLLSAIAPRMGERFDAYLPLFMPEVLKLCTRTNKIFISRAQKILAVIISNNKPLHIFPFLREAVKDKSPTLRFSATEATLLCIQEYEPKVLRAKVEDLEIILRSSVRDSNEHVRKLSKELFALYKTHFPDRVDDFSAPLTPITKRYLDIGQREKLATTSKAGPPKATKPSAAASKPPLNLSVSTSAVPTSTGDAGPSRPGIHGRSVSVSTAGLGQPVRPKLVASQTERPTKADPTVPLHKSVSTIESRSRAPSVSSGGSSRPASALAMTAPIKPSSLLSSAPSKPTKPFVPSRSVSEPSKAQRLPAESSRGTKPAAASRPPMEPSASNSSARRAAISSSTSSSAAPSSTSKNPSASAAPRPPLSRPPTAPAALLSASASRRPIAQHRPESAKSSTLTHTGGKILQGGAKRIVSAQPGKQPAASVLAQAIKKKGFVPNRAAGRPLPPLPAATLAEPGEDGAEAAQDEPRQERAGSPRAEPVHDAQAAMEAIQEDEHAAQEDPPADERGELSVEDLFVNYPGPAGEGGHTVQDDDVAGQAEFPFGDMGALEAERQVVQPADVLVPSEEGIEPVTMSAGPHGGGDLDKTVRHAVSSTTQVERHGVHEQAATSAEAEAARVARRDEKRRAFEALSAKEREAVRQHRREKKERREREREAHERRALAELQRAARVPLPADDEEPRRPSPVPAPDFAVTIPLDARTESPPLEVPVHVAAAVPLPDDADDGLHAAAPAASYKVSLPIVRMPRRVAPAPIQHLPEHESDTSCSRSATPDDAVHDAQEDGSHQKENTVALPLGETDTMEYKQVETQVKHGRAVPERAFAEVDVNVPIR